MSPEGNPTILRKACQNCTTAKRRCVAKLPRCSRCCKKGLQCIYDLEPLSADSMEVRAPQWQGSRAEADRPVHCLLQRLRVDDSYPVDVPMHEGREGIEYVVWVLRLIPSFVARNLPAIFIHPKFRRPQHDNHLTAAVENLRQQSSLGPSDKAFQDLIYMDPTTGSLEDALIAVQALMLYMIAFMFGPSKDIKEVTWPYFTQLSDWTDNLEMRAQNITTQGLSPWQGWLFGESTRRTILTSHIFNCVFNPHRYELSMNKIRMEALPFDGRSGLWLAETPQAWIAAAGEKTGRDVKTELVSWHEFSTNRPTIPMGTDGDMFLSMMLVSHNGKSRV